MDHVGTIRPANPTDVESIERLVAAAYGMYLDRMPQPPAPMLEDYDNLVDSGQIEVLTDGAAQLLGLIMLCRHDDHIEIRNLAVDPVHQGAGFGSRLMAHAECIAAEAGLGELRLYTNVAMVENITYYERHGFHVHDRRFDDGYHRVFMCKGIEVDPRLSWGGPDLRER